MFYKFIYTLLVIVLKPLFRYKISGKENIPETGPVILAANHMSYLDPILMAVVANPRESSFMAKASLFRFPVFGQVIKGLNAFPVRRGIADKAAIAHSLKVLAKGEVLTIFPEGTRHRNGQLGEAFPGVTAIALKTGAPIVPVGIIGTDKVMPNGSKLPRFPQLKVRIGAPIQVKKTAGADRKEQEAKLTAQLMDDIRKLTSGE